jgi:hypothetical protein
LQFTPRFSQQSVEKNHYPLFGCGHLQVGEFAQSLHQNPHP